jgi:hypothetical protein
MNDRWIKEEFKKSVQNLKQTEPKINIKLFKNENELLFSNKAVKIWYMLGKAVNWIEQVLRFF